jgi:hypothetical protein
MSARAGTAQPTPAEVIALARSLATPAALSAFLTANRERHARLAPIPVPAKPIAVLTDPDIEIQSPS